LAPHGSLHGFYYGVVGAGGYSWGTKAGPEVNQYSSYAGVLGTGIYVTGVAGTSLNNVGVYGQAGEIADSSIPPGKPAVRCARKNPGEGDENMI
jgi:hypothetical protein